MREIEVIISVCPVMNNQFILELVLLLLREYSQPAIFLLSDNKNILTLQLVALSAAFTIHVPRDIEYVAEWEHDHELSDVEGNNWIDGGSLKIYTDKLQVCVEVEPRPKEGDKDHEYSD